MTAGVGSGVGGGVGPGVGGGGVGRDGVTFGPLVVVITGLANVVSGISSPRMNFCIHKTFS